MSHCQMCVCVCVCVCVCQCTPYNIMVHGNTYLHMYGPHLHRRTMMMKMLWVMMGMYVPFVAPSLTVKRCPCVTSVNRMEGTILVFESKIAANA